jgi:Regulator of cell morphogenesis and NO signaling
MQTLPESPEHLPRQALDLTPESDPAVLRRWGVADCERVDRRTLTRGLTRLQDPEAPPPADRADLVRHIRSRYHRALIALIQDAVELATACEAAHSGKRLWPHGLSDRLAKLLDVLEAHQQREDAVVFPMLLQGRPEATNAVSLMTFEHAEVRALLDSTSSITCAFEAPDQACAKWRLLYLLCRKIDFDVREQMRLEESALFPPDIRDTTEASVCSDATFG